MGAGNIGQVGDPAAVGVASSGHVPVERDVSAEPWTGSLPAELTSFAGRRAELHSIRTTLSAARLVTLTGPGGCGKSRLAGRAARQQGGQWRDGAWWVDLSYETDPAGLPGRLASVVGALLISEADAMPSLVRQLADRHLLVVLDNCEHLLPAAADLVGALLRGCPHATVLATSREPLGVPGEVGGGRERGRVTRRSTSMGGCIVGLRLVRTLTA